jgi:hypothetical protein
MMHELPRNKLHKWQQLVSANENREQKSINSRDSSKHSRYTPNKHHSKSPDCKFNVAGLKDKTVSMKNLKKPKDRTDLV